MINERSYIDQNILREPDQDEPFELYCDFGCHYYTVEPDDGEPWHRIFGDRCCPDCYEKYVTRIDPREEET